MKGHLLAREYLLGHTWWGGIEDDCNGDGDGGGDGGGYGDVDGDGGGYGDVDGDGEGDGDDNSDKTSPTGEGTRGEQQKNRRLSGDWVPAAAACEWS